MYLSSILYTVSPMIKFVYNKNSGVTPTTSSADGQQRNAAKDLNLVSLVNAFRLCAMLFNQELKLLLSKMPPLSPLFLSHQACPIQFGVGWAGYLNKCCKPVST